MAVQNDGTTALIVASANGHAPVVQTLLASGANVNQGRTVSMFWLGEDDRTILCVLGSLSFSE